MAEINHIESTVKIFFTREYGQFKWLKGNRTLNESKIKKIINSINDGVNILKYAPIIVNEKMEIIDGQHRFMVSKQLKENVWYVIQNDATLSIVPAINSNSSNWKSVDFLNSYCDMGRSSYILIRDLIDSFNGMNILTAALMIHSGKVNSINGRELFKDGMIENNFESRTFQICNILNDFKPYTSNPFSLRFFEAMDKLVDNGKYDHKQMLLKLSESNRRIEDLKSGKTIIIEMESIYNHKMKSRVFIL